MPDAITEKTPALQGKFSTLTLWRTYFLLGLIQSIVALVSILVERSKSNVILLGLSGERLFMMLVVLFSCVSFAWLLIWSLIRPLHLDHRVKGLTGRLNPPRRWGYTLLLLVLLCLGGFYFITLTPEITEPFTRAYFDRLMPFVILMTGLSAQTLIALLLSRSDGNPLKKAPENKPFIIALALSGGILLAWSKVARDWLPRESQITGWNIPTAPVLETQLLVVWISCTILFVMTAAFISRGRGVDWFKKVKPQRWDLLVCLILWLGAIILWQSVPIDTNWFVTDPTHPNFEYYPSSDARQYSNTAQSALIGEGFIFLGTKFIRRPMHATYLTALYLLGGQDYESVISLQILVLALLPPFIYLLTKSLHQRISGVIAALLIMLREANAIAVGGRITTSHAKLLLVDLLTTLVVVIFTYLAVIWLRDAERKKCFALMAGGVLGAAMLIRLETFVFFFALILIAALQLLPAKKRKQWIQGVLLISLGIVLLISPWIYRNWNLTGEVFIDSPYWRSDLISQRFQPGEQPTPQPSPTPEPAQITEALPSPTLTPPVTQEVPPPQLPPPEQAEPPDSGQDVQGTVNRAWNFISQNPVLVAQFIVTHYLNSQIQSLIILPTSFRPLDSLTAFLGHRSPDQLWYGCCSVLEYVRRMPYWHKWDGRFPSQSIVPLALNLVIIAVGIQSMWKKRRWSGLLPLVFLVVYIAFHAIFRNSGGRYILPVDWVSILYVSIGLGHLTNKFVRYITDLRDELYFDQTEELTSSQNSSCSLRSVKLYLLAGALLLFGSLVPLTDTAFPKLYTDQRKNQMLSDVLQSDRLSPEQRQALETFLSQGGEVSVGRGLYPIYLPAGAGDVLKFKLEVRPYPRLNFNLLGPRSQSLVLPTVNRPSYFPNGAEIIVLHCPVIEVLNRVTDVLAVGVFNHSGSLETIIPRFPISLDLTCPLPWP